MEIKFVDGGLERAEKANGESDAAGGLKNVETATNAGDGFGEIRRATFQEMGPRLLAEHAAGNLKEQSRRQGLADGAERTAHSQGCGERSFEVQIAGTFIFGEAD